jgi:hypothetical protein
MLTCKSNIRFLFWVYLRACLYVWAAASPKVAKEMCPLLGSETVEGMALESSLTWLRGNDVFDMTAIRNKARCWGDL